MGYRTSPEKFAEWELKLLQQKESGQSASKWCKQANITKQAFYYWRDRIDSRAHITPDQFKEIPLINKGGVFIESCGFSIRLEKHFDPALLRECLKALQDSKC